MASLDELAQRLRTVCPVATLTKGASWEALSESERAAWRALAEIAELVGLVGAADAMTGMIADHQRLIARLRDLEGR